MMRSPHKASPYAGAAPKFDSMTAEHGPLRKVCLAGVSVALAGAAVVAASTPAQAVTSERQWWGVTVYTNKGDTNALKYGSGLAGVLGYSVPPAAAAAGAFALYADWAQSRGACLKFTIVNTRVRLPNSPTQFYVVPSHYWGGHCR